MIRPIDHVVVAIPDLEEAASAFEEHGFTVTPRADHPFGTSNRLVVTESSYVELVSVTVPELVPESGFAAVIRRLLDQDRPGIALLVLKSDDAVADHAELVSRGEAAGEVLSFERPAPLVDGGTTRAAFSVAFTKTGKVFYCQHHTPEAIWNPGAMTHRNGVRRLTGVGFDSGQTLPGVDVSQEPGITFDRGTRTFTLPGLTVHY